MTELSIDQVVAEHEEHNGKVEVFNANLHKELFDRHRFYDLAEMQRRLAAHLHHLHWYGWSTCAWSPRGASIDDPERTHE